MKEINMPNEIFGSVLSSSLQDSDRLMDKENNQPSNLYSQYQTDDSKLNVITYNVQQIIGAKLINDRRRAVIEYIKANVENADIWVLEECFLPSFVADLKKNLGEQYNIVNQGGINLTPANSGVVMLVKKELETKTVQKVTYSFATSVDRLAFKGFTHQTVTKDKQKNHIIGTHTQAQYTGSEHQVIATLAQLAALGDYLKTLPKEDSVIVTGDLNIYKNTVQGKESSDFKILKYLLYPLIDHDFESKTFDKDNSLNEGVKDHFGTLDYIFSKSKGEVQALKPKYSFNNNELDISDHYPVKAVLNNEKLAVLDENDILHQQKEMISRILRFSFDRASQRQFFNWRVKPAGTIYHASCQFVEYYDNLTDDEKRSLSSSTTDPQVFFNHCLAYKPQEGFDTQNRFFDKGIKKTISLNQALLRNNKESKIFFKTFLLEESLRLNSIKSNVELVSSSEKVHRTPEDNINYKLDVLSKSIVGPFNFLAQRRTQKYMALQYVKNLSEEDLNLGIDGIKKYIATCFPLYNVNLFGKSGTEKLIEDYVTSKMQTAGTYNTMIL